MGPSGLTLALTLTLNFQGQISNWLYLSQKWSDCHETNSKHIDWTLGFKWDHRVWPWPWPWIFKVKYRIGYISAKNGPIATKQKANTSTELWPRPWTDIWIFKVVCDLDHLVTKVRCKDLPDIMTGVTSVVGVLSTHLVFSEIVLGWMPMIPSQHWFR